MDAEGCPRVLILEVVEDLESEVVVVGGVSGWRGAGGEEGGEGVRRRCGRRHGEWTVVRDFVSVQQRVYVKLAAKVVETN